MANTPNKNYPLQATGADVNTWGIVANSIFSTIDANLGGTLALSVAGSSNVTLTADQAKNLIHNLSGVLTGNIDYTFPAQGGFFAIKNGTTGAFNITVKVTGGSGVIIPQGTTGTVYIDATVPAVYAFSGSQSVYSAVAVAGTPNALTIAQTIPSGFTLIQGSLMSFVPTDFNTVPGPTVNFVSTGNLVSKIVGPTGLTDLPAFGYNPGSPIIGYYDGTYFVVLNFVYSGMVIAQNSALAVDISTLFNCYYATGPFTATITQSTNLATFWWAEFNALSGAITLTPNAADSINGGVAGASFIMPQGTSGKLETDTAGKLILNFCDTNISNGRLATMATHTIKSNITGGSATPSDNTLTSILDLISSTQGSILYRDASAWLALGPGTIGQLLKTQGASANPAWVTVPTPTGLVLQIVESMLGTVFGPASVIPLDDTIPQNSEGDEFTTLAITPQSASSTLIIDVVVQVSYPVGTAQLAGIAALFVDSTANALAAGFHLATGQNTGGAGQSHGGTISLTFKVSSASTSARTYKIRVGNCTVNGIGSGRIFGGVMKSGIRVTEVL